MDTITLCSLNVRGLADSKKRKDVFIWLREKKINIYCLQDVHCAPGSKDRFRSDWGGDVFISTHKNNSRGVAILFNNNFEYTVQDQIYDNHGNIAGLKIALSNQTIALLTIYGPNKDEPEFYKTQLSQCVVDLDCDFLIICGDWNVVQQQDLDTHGYLHENNVQAKAAVLSLKQQFELVDPWRLRNPSSKEFTWKNGKMTKFGRLDFFLVSDIFHQLIQSTDILPGYRTDHSLICLTIKTSQSFKGKGFWKFNTSLLNQLDYVEKVKDTIKRVASQYNRNHINNDNNHDTDDILFWEILKMEIRGMTIKYSSELKKQRERKYKFLEMSIQILEKGLYLAKDEIKKLYDSYNNQLQELRQGIVKGAIMRSKVQWFEEGERVSKYFCALEKRNFINKTITKLNLGNNIFTEEPSKILDAQKIFYKDLYTSRLSDINRENGQEYIRENKSYQLTTNQRETLDQEFTEEEVATSIKSMRNNKTPGTDGFPIEFYKFFWVDIKKYLIKCFKQSFVDGKLSINQKRGIISCLPKGNKDKQLLKNWRPISLLNTDYKIITHVLAERLKHFIPCIIHSDQKGFVKGRFIGENTRLLYDVMKYLEVHQRSGLLFLIDFEKAFDSVEWAFIDYTLKTFNFGDNFRKWFDILYKDAESCVINNGTYSEFFKLNRGCRQGDPISPYLFILVAEILANSIRKNDLIRGIKIKNKMFTLGQYADDTFVLLDGSKESLSETIKCLDMFAKFSGLKINMDKCEVIWLGSKKYSLEQPLPGLKLGKDFKLLGVTFPIKLEQINEVNLNSKVADIEKLFKAYEKRHLSLLGRVTVIKSLAISKLIHVLSVTETPTMKFLNYIERLFQNLLWNNKVSRIKYNYATKSIEEGGLKLPNLKNLCCSLKMAWIKRSYDTGSWQELFKIIVDDPDLIWKLDPKSLNILARKYCKESPFWSDALKSYALYLTKNEIKCFRTITEYTFWNSYYISSTNIVKLKDSLIQKGCKLIKDLLTENHMFYSLGEFQHKFQSQINFLDYETLKRSFPVEWKYSNFQHEDFTLNYQSVLGSIIKCPKICSLLTENLAKHGEKRTIHEIKWSELLSANIDTAAW